MPPSATNSPIAVLEHIWTAAGLNPGAIAQIDLPTRSQCLPSSFNVGIAAQCSIGAAALAATELYRVRTGASQRVRVATRAAELECTGYFRLDGKAPNAWEKFSGLYEAADGYLRVHANFDHHRDGVLELLGLGSADSVERDDVAAALAQWPAAEFEAAAAERGLVVAMVRSFAEWDVHPHAVATRGQPLIAMTKLDDAPPRHPGRIGAAQRPLAGIRVLDLTRILAGPICGRTLAAYGADVMLVNSPRLPNIAAIIDTSRGKRSCLLELKDARGVATLKQLLRDARIFVQGYRPGALAQLGLSPAQLAESRPGIVAVSLSAYGNEGPWADRRGFDSLVQTVSGFNHAEAQAANAAKPRTLPVPILDYASGFLMAFGAQAALLRQATEGGSWHVEVSLLQTANWLRSLGRRSDGFDVEPLQLGDSLARFACAEGKLEGMPHAAEFSATPPIWTRPSVLPGTHEPSWDG